ncbi:MAG: rod shape-determining protein MreC [Massilistercora timonensis]
MKIKNQSSFPSKYRLFILIAICVILLGIGSVVDSSGPLRFVANYTVIPFQKGISYAGQWMSDVSANFQTMEEMRSENESLQSKVDELTIDNTRLRQEQYELERLRELYKLDENYSDYEKIGARVISNNGTNWFSDFTIDKGSNDGIKENCNVLAGSGLVGVVTEVGPNYARVRSIIDDASNVSAMMLSTSDLCMVEGNLELIADGRLRFERLPNNDNEIEVGEQVVTSHVSDRFVQGLFIGYVSDIEVDSNNLTRSGYITPAVDFSKLQEVLVITKTKDDLVNEQTEKTDGDSAAKEEE